MAREAAAKLLSIDDFLDLEDGADARHELIDGVPVAMAPASRRHATIRQNVGDVIQRAVRGRPPCRAAQQAGIAIEAGPPGRLFVADVVMTCEPDADAPTFDAPRLVVEVLSPSTRGHDERWKVPAYGRLPSVEEIWLVGAEARWVIAWQRDAGGWHAGLPLIGEASFASRVLAATVTLDELYRLTSL